MSQIQARFYISEIRKTASFAGVGVTLLPVTRATPDNVSWSRYTPSGKFEMNVTDEGAAATFEAALRKEVLITFEIEDEE